VLNRRNIPWSLQPADSGLQLHVVFYPLASWNTWTYWLQLVQQRAIFLMQTIVVFLWYTYKSCQDFVRTKYDLLGDRDEFSGFFGCP